MSKLDRDTTLGELSKILADSQVLGFDVSRNDEDTQYIVTLFGHLEGAPSYAWKSKQARAAGRTLHTAFAKALEAFKV